MRLPLILLHALFTPFLGLVSHVSADNLKMWIDASCETKQVQSINEARWLSKRMDEQLGAQDLSLFTDWLDWFFKIDSSDQPRVEYLRNTYRRIGAMERVLERKDSKLRIYCDNMKGFVTEDGSKPKVGSQEFKSKPFKWEQEEIATTGEHLSCLDGTADGVTFEDPEYFWKERSLPLSGNLPSDRTVITLCDNMIKDKEHDSITKEAALWDLEKLPHASEPNIGSCVVLHEFVHVPSLSSQVITDAQGRRSVYASGTDTYGKDASGAPALSGYFEPGMLPSAQLKSPKLLMMNPDSYAFTAIAWQLRKKKWEMYRPDQNKQDLKWRRNNNLQSGPDPDWSQEDKDNPWNWSDNPTPDGHIN